MLVLGVIRALLTNWLVSKLVPCAQSAHCLNEPPAGSVGRLPPAHAHAATAYVVSWTSAAYAMENNSLTRRRSTNIFDVVGQSTTPLNCGSN